MHPELAIVLYRHQEHELAHRLELRRTQLERRSGPIAQPRHHRPHLPRLADRRHHA